MLVESNMIVPITRLQKELTKTVRELSETGEPVFILKNNAMEAVMVPFEEYEYLKQLEEMYEYFEVKGMLEQRMRNYDASASVPWSTIKA